MNLGLGIEHVIDISTEIQGSALGAADFGTGLIFTSLPGGINTSSTNRLSAHGGKKVYKLTKHDQILSFFNPINNEEAKIINDVNVWFSSNPEPKPLYIGRLVQNSFPTTLYTDILDSDDLAAIGVDDAKWGFSINGKNVNITNPSQLTSWSNIATVLQGIMRNETTVAGFAGVEITVTPDSRLKFDFKESTGGTAGVYGDIKVSKSTTSGFDDQTLFGRLWARLPEEGKYSGNNVVATGGGYYEVGNETAENLESALNEIISFASGGHPTALMLGSDLLDATIGSVKAIEALRGISKENYISSFVEEVNFTSTTTKPDTGSEVTKNEGNKNCIGIHSKPSEGSDTIQRTDIALLAKLSSQDFDEPDSIITVVPKPLDGVNPTGVTSTQIEKLEAVNASVYTTVGGYPSFLGGKVGAGYWVDAQWWLLWLKNEMESQIFSALRSSNRLKNIELTDVIHQVMAKALRSGGIQLGGQLNLTLTNEVRRFMDNPGFDGKLQNGYVLWIQGLQNATDTDRNNRHAKFKVWISPSEAIHSVSGGIVLSG